MCPVEVENSNVPPEDEKNSDNNTERQQRQQDLARSVSVDSGLNPSPTSLDSKTPEPTTGDKENKDRENVAQATTASILSTPSLICCDPLSPRPITKKIPLRRPNGMWGPENESNTSLFNAQTTTTTTTTPNPPVMTNPDLMDAEQLALLFQIFSNGKTINEFLRENGVDLSPYMYVPPTCDNKESLFAYTGF